MSDSGDLLGIFERRRCRGYVVAPALENRKALLVILVVVAALCIEDREYC